MADPTGPTPPDPSEPVEAEIVDAETVEQPPPAPDYDEHGVPSLNYVRDKIEGRYAAALGGTELAADTEAGRTLEQQAAERDEAARAKLEEIRRSLGR